MAYYCPAGVLTVAFGHTGADVKPGMVVTEAQGEDLLRRDLVRFEKAVFKNITVPLNENQFSSLVSLCYNCGTAPLTGTLGRVLNKGDYAAVPAQIMRWTKAGGKELKGLVRRRRAEVALWRGLDDEGDDEPTVTGTITPSSSGRSLSSSKTVQATAVGAVGGLSLVGQGIAANADAISTLASTANGLGPHTLMVLGVVVLAGCAYMLWRRWQDRELHP